ncbi:FAD binding domain-containing protein [Desarmillaria tabescens]|uniref:FAD binding domain-containing protein n=1 Tax=Armillaria tabescens TaxID=1929756 RepID=A0AA39NQJ0_ARMTA|nr:FAD binding domain-containing protein [Desarmillaria tabescens]KAK0469981.1 FAD binding domain-containing protein [Desarmillaria tabescens]
MGASVLIVGSGLSGLVLALALLRNGVSVRIIDKAPKFGVGQRGCGIQPRTLELYKILGILPQVLELARPVPIIHLHSSPEGNNPPKILDLNAAMENTPLYPCINPMILGQDRHEELIRSYLRQEYNCEVELATELVSFEQQATCIIAHLSHGGGTTETVVSDWLVGTDGAHSTVRKQLGLTFMGESRTSDSLVVGDVHVKGGLGDREHWPFWGNDFVRKVVSLRPFEIKDDDRYNFMMGGLDIDHDKVASSREELIKLFYEVSGRRDVEFGDLIWMGIWRPNIRMVDKFGKGRVFVAGDAAHVHPPAGGQGMNSGVQDSLNLAWKLALVQKNIAPVSILESYTQERMPVIAYMLNMTDGLIKSTMKEGGTGEGFSRDFNLRQLGVNYRGSTLVVDEKHTRRGEFIDPYRSGEDGTVRGGDRAPDAPGLVAVNDDSISTSLFEIFQFTCHTVLIFSDPKDDQSDILNISTSYPQGLVQSVVIYPQSTTPPSMLAVHRLADHVFADRDGFAYKNYNIVGSDATKVVVVRPDGYIGALISGADSLASYFGAIFLGQTMF